MTPVEIINYIPQRPPFVMVDELLSADETVSVTVFNICEGHLFVDEGYLTEPGLIENMAQTAAAGTGFKAVQSGNTPSLGFIGALKNLIIKELPKTGEQIKTRITLLHSVMNALIAKGEVFVDDKEIASCEFKIFLQPNS